MDRHNLTAAQRTALVALFAAKARNGARFVEATDLDGVSGSALSALVRKGLVTTSASIARTHGWDVPAYSTTVTGTIAARRIVEG